MIDKELSTPNTITMKTIAKFTFICTAALGFVLCTGALIVIVDVLNTEVLGFLELLALVTKSSELSLSIRMAADREIEVRDTVEIVRVVGGGVVVGLRV